MNPRVKAFWRSFLRGLWQGMTWPVVLLVVCEAERRMKEDARG